MRLLTSATILPASASISCVGHGLLARLNRDGDRERLLARLDALAFIDVEHRHAGDQLLVDILRRADEIGGLHLAVDDEGEVARHRLERRQFEHRLGAGRLRLRLGDPIENHFEADDRPVRLQRLQRARMQFAEMAEHILRPDLDGAGAAGMKPGRSAGHDLQRLHRRTGCGERGQRIGLGIEGIGSRPFHPVQKRPVPVGRDRPCRRPAAAMN